MVIMTRTAPEVSGQPTCLDVPDCDVEALKARGWSVKSEVKAEKKPEPAKAGTPVEAKPEAKAEDKAETAPAAEAPKSHGKKRR